MEREGELMGFRSIVAAAKLHGPAGFHSLRELELNYTSPLPVEPWPGLRDCRRCDIRFAGADALCELCRGQVSA